jgi:ABC-type branched-subunit amino acid transport system ATPase component
MSAAGSGVTWLTAPGCAPRARRSHESSASYSSYWDWRKSPGIPVVGLPLGTSRLVEVAQALATRPKVVLLDEPASGLDPRETGRLVTALNDVVAAHGVSLLLVEHDVEMVMNISDTI